MSAQSSARPRRQSIASVIAVVLILVFVGIAWLIANRHSSTPVSASTTPAATATTSPRSTSTGQVPLRIIPVRVADTLALIDAGRWPEAANAPGTQGGRTFRNNEGRLPRTDAAGRPMRYQEWDVNAKAPGRGRDAERIITAADGRVWYSLDHYRTFVQIRGPNS